MIFCSGVLFFFTCTHQPIPTTTFQGFCADAHQSTLKCWWVVGGVGWTMFRDSPYESDFILMTQARAKICGLLIFSYPVWELHTSAATSPLLFSVASTTNLVGHDIGRDRPTHIIICDRKCVDTLHSTRETLGGVSAPKAE